MPKVNVIIPTYNCAKYLPEAIDSVLKQTYKDYEIIIIDDGSTDHTKDVLEKYIVNKAVKYIYQNNKGKSYARNEGLRNASGKYICFLDSDDIMLPQNLDLKVKYAEQNDLKLIFSDYYIVSSQGDRLDNIYNLNPHLKSTGYVNLIKEKVPDFVNEQFLYILPKIDFLRVAIKKLGMSTCTVFIDSDFLFNQARVFFDTKLAFAQDVDLWCNLLLSPYLEKIGYLDLPLASYRYYNAKWVHSPQREYFLYVWISRFINGLERYSNSIGRRYFAEAIWEILWGFKQNKLYRFYFFKKIFHLYPWKFKYWKSFFILVIKSIFNKMKSYAKN